MAIKGAVLTGGRSKRFGSNKALEPVRGVVMAKVAVSAIRAAGVDPVVLVGGDLAVSAASGTPLIADRWPEIGPLGGWATALQWANAPRNQDGHVLVSPCDLPLLSFEAVSRLISAVLPNTAAVAVIDGRPNPIFGIWPTAWAEAAAHAVRLGHRKMSDSLELGEWTGVEFSEMELADADTPVELARILEAGVILAVEETGVEEISERTE